MFFLVIAAVFVFVEAKFGCHEINSPKNLHLSQIIPIFAPPKSTHIAHENNKHYKPSLIQTT